MVFWVAFLRMISSPTPVAFIVEGHGEFEAYPSLAQRITGSAINYPCVNAVGYSGITSNLSAKLSRLVITHHPDNVIITLDLRDTIIGGVYRDCADALTNLNENVERWYLDAKTNPRLSPLPQTISVVLQIQTFETWLISDITKLIDQTTANDIGGQPADVDDTIPDPVDWIKNNLPRAINPKSPVAAKRMIQQLDPIVMRKNSRSFDKFYRELVKIFPLNP